jgi:hypothetical protein
MLLKVLSVFFDPVIWGVALAMGTIIGLIEYVRQKHSDPYEDNSEYSEDS